MLKFLKLTLLASTIASGCTTSESLTLPEHVDEEITLEMLNACIQTYRHFSKKEIHPPEGWEWKGGYWEGYDFFAKTSKKEFFGLIFHPADGAKELLFAFRGTSTIEEWWDDAHAKPVSFSPYSATSIPEKILVEEGFHNIYESMREELFQRIEEDQPQKVYVTGHSLGSALSELFVFDLSLSYPDLEIISYNFACPRLGNKHFADFYHSLPSQKTSPTVRFVNTRDIVPKIPLTYEGYVHLPNKFDIDFRGWLEIFPNYALRHSADNYYRVLEKKLGLQMPVVYYDKKEAKLRVK